MTAFHASAWQIAVAALPASEVWRKANEAKRAVQQRAATEKAHLDLLTTLTRQPPTDDLLRSSLLTAGRELCERTTPASTLPAT